MKKQHKNIDGLKVMQSLYDEPEKKRKRKKEDAEKRPNSNWKNRKRL